jgi:hypothetical protein
MSVEREGRYASALDMQSALHAATSENKSLASRVYNDSWKDAQALKQGRDEEQRVRDEHQLMQAETVRLSASEAADLRREGLGSSGSPDLLTEPMIVQQLDTEEGISFAAPSPTPAFVTEHAVAVHDYHDVKPDATVSERKADVFSEPREAPPQKKVPAKRKPVSRTPFLIAGLVVAAIFLTLGFAGVLWVGGVVGGRSQNTVPNTNSNSPVETPTPYPTPLPTSTVSVLVVDPTPMPTPTPTPRPTPVTTPEPTPQRTPRPTPTPRIVVPAKTPTPRRTPPKQTQDPNCVYTNTCKS